MGIFGLVGHRKKDVVNAKFFNLHSLIRASFGNVKRDTALIFQWLNYYNQKIAQQDYMIAELKKEILMVPKREDVRKIIEEAYSYEDIVKRLNAIEERLAAAAIATTVAAKDSAEMAEITALKARLESMEKKKVSIRDRLIKKITKNSKDYVKSILLSLIKKYEKVPALQLKEMVVDEQGLCSKSSFYRLLEEIEERDDIGVIKEGKEKHYIAKLTNQTN